MLARGGVGSRREIERWIAEGRLKLNGEIVKLGDRLKARDYLQLNERVVHWEKFAVQPTRVLLYHKPTGEVVTRRDPEGRPVVFTQLPTLTTARWISVVVDICLGLLVDKGFQFSSDSAFNLR